MECSIPGCSRRFYARSWCDYHYGNWLRKGDANWKPETLEERIVRRTEIDEQTGCHNWTGTVMASGYGYVGYKGKQCRVHRVIWAQHHGDIPEGLIVRHSCHNRRCVNIEHLMLGTVKDNSDDMTRAKRQARGEKIGTSKLMAEQVLEIRAADPDIPHAALGRRFGVSGPAIREIRNRRVWKHI